MTGSEHRFFLSWFEYFDRFLALILHKMEDPDPKKLIELKTHIDDKRLELEKAIQAADPSKYPG